MAPNPRVRNAFRAMKAIGISEIKVKPVLKRLLILYDKNWELIEEENYRVLADAIFDEDDSKGGDCGDEAEVPDEPEQPLKRSWQRGQDVQSSSFVDNSGPTALKKPKLEENGLSSISPQSNGGSMGKQPASPIDSGGQQVRHSYKGKEPMLPPVSHKEKRPIVQRSYQPLRIKDTVADPGSVRTPKQKVPDTPSFIIPKDEPYTDDEPQNMAPLSVVMPAGFLYKENTSVERASDENQDEQEPPASHVDSGEDKDDDPPVKSQVTSVPENSPVKMEISSSSLGEESLVHATPSIGVPEKSAGSCAPEGGPDCLAGSIPNGSIDIHHFVDERALQIPRQLQQVTEDMHPGMVESNGVKELEDSHSHSLVAAPQHQPTSEELRSLDDFNDLTKGEEKVQIGWLNEINNQPPPSFHYIPRNLIFQNANLKFSLSQIKDEDCCSSCLGDCLSSTAVCVCASETGDKFAYTSDGLLRDDFLAECMTMTRDPRQQHLLYCKACPFERSKNDVILEPCKGHLSRRYIKECWNKCACHKQCGNRVVQRGIRCKLQVFFTPDGKGWGLRTLEKLPRGTFICEYVGEILTNKELHERNMQRTRGTNKQHTHPVLLDTFWFHKGAVKDEDALCLDATFYGNVARFINHRCLDANLIEIPVKMETPDNHYYHLAFFTTRDVDALEELTWDYGIDFDDNDQTAEVFRCLCGSKFCRNMKRSSRSKSVLR